VGRLEHLENWEDAGQDHWESELFHFVRLMKAHPALAGLPPADAFAAIEAALRRTHRLGVREVWGAIFGMEREDAQAEVLSCWEKVRWAPGQSPLVNALRLATERPLLLAKDVVERRSDGYPRFIGLAGWLQASVGDRDILLPTRDVAELLRVTPMTISRYRDWAVEDGYLKLVAPSSFRPVAGARNKATAFRFDTSRWDFDRMDA
jgi:hypothetical protein